MRAEVTEKVGATGNVHWDKEDASDRVIYVNEYDSGLVDCLGQKMEELVDNFQSKFIEIYLIVVKRIIFRIKHQINIVLRLIIWIINL